MREWIPFAIGKPSDATEIVGRENVPRGDDFAWWSHHYEYKDKDGEYLTTEGFQNKYQISLVTARDIIEQNYLDAIEVYVMNVNHPRYIELVGNTNDICWDDN